MWRDFQGQYYDAIILFIYLFSEKSSQVKKLDRLFIFSRKVFHFFGMEDLREFIRNFLTSNSSMCIVDTSIVENIIRQFYWQSMFLQSALPRNYYMNLG